jgi:hypothetical protein
MLIRIELILFLLLQMPSDYSKKKAAKKKEVSKAKGGKKAGNSDQVRIVKKSAKSRLVVRTPWFRLIILGSGWILPVFQDSFKCWGQLLS